MNPSILGARESFYGTAYNFVWLPTYFLFKHFHLFTNACLCSVQAVTVTDKISVISIHGFLFIVQIFQADIILNLILCLTRTISTFFLRLCISVLVFTECQSYLVTSHHHHADWCCDLNIHTLPRIRMLSSSPPM